MALSRLSKRAKKLANLVSSKGELYIDVQSLHCFRKTRELKIKRIHSAKKGCLEKLMADLEISDLEKSP